MFAEGLEPEHSEVRKLSESQAAEARPNSDSLASPRHTFSGSVSPFILFEST